MKEKIKSIVHTEKIWWIRVKPTDNSLLLIDKILKKYDPTGLGWGLEDYTCDQERKSERLVYNKWKNKSMNFYSEIESGYLFFMQDRIDILLRKESKLFEKLKKEFLKHFEFVKNEYSKKSQQNI